jgi:CTP synthase (UTP-ammonia lyase)
MSVEMREKIALFCSVEKDAVVQNIGRLSIYEIPVMLGVKDSGPL